MYEKKFVKRRVRNTLIGVVGAISTTGVTILCIIAFLGRYVGSFTVSLDAATVSLSLAKESSFEDPQSYLRVDTLPGSEEIEFNQLPSDEELDNEENDYLYGADYNKAGEVTRLRFFKYTFFVKNTGEIAASYSMHVVVHDNTVSTDGRTFLDTIRVMVYSNEVQHDPEKETHKKEVYARRRSSEMYDHWETPISTREDQVDSTHPFQGYATPFESDDVICTYTVENFGKNDEIRYTLVTWLEGNDENSNHKLGAPEGASLKLGVEINAYEN